MIRRLLCLWRGHDDVFVFEPTRLALCCTKCNRVTPGMVLDLPRPVPR